MTPDDYREVAHAVPYVAKGIWYGELYLFLSTCASAGVDLLIETGIKSGHSTRVLSAVFGGPIYSVDRTCEIELPPGVTFVAGDAHKVVPSIIKQHPDATIGLLIDGPKGASALALKRAVQDRCAVVAIHDVPFDPALPRHSHQPAWQAFARARGLDTPVPEMFQRKYPQGGPGLAVWRPV